MFLLAFQLSSIDIEKRYLESTSVLLSDCFAVQSKLCCLGTQCVLLGSLHKWSRRKNASGWRHVNCQLSRQLNTLACYSGFTTLMFMVFRNVEIITVRRREKVIKTLRGTHFLKVSVFPKVLCTPLLLVLLCTSILFHFHKCVYNMRLCVCAEFLESFSIRPLIMH